MNRKAIMTRRLRRHEEHTNHEAWAIPYGDLLTLLLAFFVVMYAMSSVNAGKYRVLSDSLFAAFRGTPRTMDPIQIGEKQTGSGSELESAVVQSQLKGQQRAALAPVPIEGGNQASGESHINTALPPKAVAPGTDGNAASGAAAVTLQRVADEVTRAMEGLVQQNLVVVRRTDFWIEVEIKTDLLFPSGSAQLAPNAVDVIQRLGGALSDFPNPIRVEGHTDNRPIKTVAFYSNWELSAARAGSVVRVLQARGVAPGRLAVIGYGDQRPVQSNDTEQGRNANRRVVVVILSTELQRQKDQNGLPGAPALLAPPTVVPAPTPAGNTASLQSSGTEGGAAVAFPAPAAVATAAPTTPIAPGEPAQLPNRRSTPSAARAAAIPLAVPPNVTLSSSTAPAAAP